MLSDSESESGGALTLTVNEHYAKAYSKKKEREELSKLKDKYGSDVDEISDESDDSEDTTEDEDGAELTPAVDAAILRTLARIKRKDPAIYESGKDVFDEEQQKTKTSAPTTRKVKEKSKPLLMRQHVLNSTLDATSRSPSPNPPEPTHVEEQAALRQETISAFHTALAGGPDAQAESDSDEDLLVPREKTKDETEREEEKYREYLAREVGEDISRLVTVESGEAKVEQNAQEGGMEAEDDNERNEDKKKKKKKKKAKAKEDADHEFLMNYILNRGWIDRSSQHVPTYNEVTASSSKEKSKGKKVTFADDDIASRVNIVGANGSEGAGASDEGDFDEEDFDEVAENFESSYNFRFEEPDAASIPAHPRNIALAVRREENPRKAARERKQERKQEKLLQKREEVKRLKALKIKDIREKLERIGREGGKSADDEALAQLDLEGDWDPHAYDKQMEGLYGEEDAEYVDKGEDMEKPNWEDDIDIDDIIPDISKPKKKKDKKKRKRDDDEDDGVDIDAMDADQIGTSKLKRKGKAAELDELYGLDFNDMVGDLPTRFKYTPVLPQMYGMDPVEILLADDADLNSVVGLRALAPYRRDKGRTWDPNRGEKLQDFRKKLQEKRGYVAESQGGAKGGQDGEQGSAKKRKGKKERTKAKLAAAVMTEEEEPMTGAAGSQPAEADGEQPSKKRKRRHKKPLTSAP